MVTKARFNFAVICFVIIANETFANLKDQKYGIGTAREVDIKFFYYNHLPFGCSVVWLVVV